MMLDELEYIKKSLDKIEGLATGIDATAEHTVRQRALLRLVDDIRLNLKKLATEIYED